MPLLLPPSAPRREKVLHYLALVGRLAFLYRILRLILVDGVRHVRARGLLNSFKDIQSFIRNTIVRLMLSLPSSRRQLASELGKAREDMRKSILGRSPGEAASSRTRVLPEEGRDKEWLAAELERLKGMEKGEVEGGRVSGTVYHGGADLNKVMIDAMSKFIVSNPLHASIFPGLRQMESEIVSMCLNLFNGPNGAGTTTSGGTESILMSVKTHRDWARDVKGIKNPEMVVPSSAHAAFNKASQYFGIKLRIIPVDPETRKADVRWMARAINPNTIMLVGSAPNFPDGVIDPIPALAALARKHKIGLHVDCCLGSFLMPFLGRAGLGEGIEPFDFRLEGVTAISCDVHKYAFCPKGCSVIMYRSKELRRYQYYVITDWPGGVYASPSMAGSRPGMILAGAWAVINHMGANGYTDSCRTIVTAARSLAASLRNRFPEDIYVLGNPLVSVVAFGSKTVNIYAVGDKMSEKGWHLSALANPPSLHMAFTLPSAGSVDKLLDDLEVCVAAVKAGGGEGGKQGDMVALYGVGQTSIGPHVVGKLAEAYLDVTYE